MAEEIDFKPTWLHEKPDHMFPEDWTRLTQAYWLYTSMYFRHTEITKNFLHPLNVAFIISTINSRMSELTAVNFMCREFYTSEFQQSLADVAYGNSSYVNTGNNADRARASVDKLTASFIDMWLSDLWIGWRNEARFRQWALEDERIRFFPYAESQGSNDIVNTSNEKASDYLLSSPWNKGYEDFLLRNNRPTCINPEDSTSVKFFFNKILGNCNKIQ